MKQPEEEFYVGYMDPAPPALGRWLRRAAAATLVLAVALAAAVGMGQRPLPDASFEFGAVHEFEGYLVHDPYPSILVPEGAATDRHLLVAPGKRGAEALTGGGDDRRVRLEGKRISRGTQTMLEVVPGSVADTPGPGPPLQRGAIEDLGVRYAEGEIVDSKCYLGVMNPGSGIAHRACATLCIRGGIPPLLAVSHVDGTTEGLVLVDEDGGPIGDALLDLAAQAVGVTGRVVRVGPTTYMHVDPLNIRRLE